MLTARPFNTPGGVAPDPWPAIRSAVAGAWREIGLEMTLDLRKRVSVPVVFVASVGPIGANGRRPISYAVTVRSRPGEPPRLETGQHYASINFAVDDTQNAEGSPVELTVFSDGRYAASLEFKAPDRGGRPHFRPLLSDWAPRLAPRAGFAAREVLRAA